MNQVLQDREIALFRYRNRLLAGVSQGVARGKMRFALSKKEAVNVPAENLLQATGVCADNLAAGERWMAEAEATSHTIELHEVWDLVQDEGEVWEVADLAELYFDGAATPQQMSAFLIHLETSSYFAPKGKRYFPLGESEVAQRRADEARQAARAAEQTLFETWLDEAKPTEVDSEMRLDWLGHLKAYVLDDGEGPHGHWIERMAGCKVPVRQVFEKLVHEGVWQADEFLDLLRAEVPVVFAAPLTAAADALNLDTLLDEPGRRDLTGWDVITIDDVSTTDMDDGISLQVLEDGTCLAGVHITDVSALVLTGSALDTGAFERCASLYFPDQKIPMLPKQISSHLGSLKPDVPRLALSFLFPVGAAGEVGAPEIVPSVICCREKLSYEAVDDILENPGHRLYNSLNTLHEVAEAHLVERMQEGAVPLVQVNRRVRLGPGQEIEVSLGPRNSRSDLLVSELMVMVNVACARLCQVQDIPMIYRTQVSPDLSGFEDTENEILHRYRLLRRMRPALSSLEPGLHGGLGVSPYCQASSPLRRYGDLVVQRQVSAALRNAPLPYDAEQLQNIAVYMGERGRLIGRLEWRRERYWIYTYLQSLRGRTFEAVVLEAWERAFRADILEVALQAEVRLSRPVTPGECVEVQLGRCDPWADEILFNQV